MGQKRRLGRQYIQIAGDQRAIARGLDRYFDTPFSSRIQIDLRRIKKFIGRFFMARRGADFGYGVCLALHEVETNVGIEHGIGTGDPLHHHTEIGAAHAHRRRRAKQRDVESAGLTLELHFAAVGQGKRRN
jgi:hypothetical protein